MEHNRPHRNTPAQYLTMDSRERFAETQTALHSALAHLQTHMWTALPGQIESYDSDANTVEVQPTVQGLITHSDGNTHPVDLPVLPDVPVYFPRGGGVTFTFPIQKGDECLVIFSSRCIDGWWQSGGSQLAPEFRMHDLSDGFALIGPMSQPNRISGISTSTAQIRSDDGKAYIELDPSSHKVTVNTPANVDATCSLFDVHGDVNIHGTLTLAGMNMNTHYHTGNDGNNTTGPHG